MKRDIVVRRTVRDPFGDPVGQPVEHTIQGVILAPRYSREEDQLGAQVIVGYQIFPPFGADIKPSDQVVVLGQPWDVEGERGDWEDPFDGQQMGAQLALVRST